MSVLKRVGLLQDLFLAFQFALWPTLRRIWTNPSILFHPTALSRFFFSRVWAEFGTGLDGNTTQLKSSLITPNAYGVVLDVGAAYGHTVNYLDSTRVTKYVALEPNPHMHNQLRRVANTAGFTEEAGTLVLLACGAEDTNTILSSLGRYQPIDTIISILTFCSVPEPQETIRSLVTDVLKPGGQLLFLEHVQNPLSPVAWWQGFWSPLWAIAFDGCRLDRPTHLWIQQVDGWVINELRGVEGEDKEHLFWHYTGKFVKAA